MIKILSNNELEQVNGGSPAHAAGAVVGAIGGAFGAIIAGNTSSGSGATGQDILNGAIAGAVGGAFSPIRSIQTIATLLGAAVVGGGMVHLANEIRVGQKPK